MEKKNVFFLFSNISGNNSKKESNFCATSINNGHFKKGFTNTVLSATGHKKRSLGPNEPLAEPM